MKPWPAPQLTSRILLTASLALALLLSSHPTLGTSRDPVSGANLYALLQEGEELPEGGADTVPPAEAIRWHPPTSPEARDNPNDYGHGILVEWELSPDDESLLRYEIQRGPSPDAPDSAWLAVGTAAKGSDSFVYTDTEETIQDQPNPKFVPRGEPIFLRVRGVAADGSVSPWTRVVTGVAKSNWFNTGKINVLLAVLLFGFLVITFIVSSRRGAKLYIRPIPGLGAVDEAIGRATEMGRPILYVLGTGTASEIGTIAGYTILARVARRTAEYQTPILVPVNDPVMLAMGQEVVKEAYLQAGRPEVYKPENVSYISALQFPFVAAVNGLMLRERAATNFYMGVFHAESLLLAETGSVTGAIQVSGTDQLSQIPFFVAATDYTLIGEELYAASAYLSQEPKQMGPLKAQDWIKVLIMALIVGGVITVTFGWTGILRLVQTVT